MIAKITFLTSLSFAVLYPLCFWVSADEPLKNKFHHFHLGLPAIISGVVFIFALTIDLPAYIKVSIGVWSFVFLLMTWKLYSRDYAPAHLVSIPVLFGIFALLKAQSYLIGSQWQVTVAGLLGGLIFCSSLYAMNLGHWYLNVHGLPLKHLKNSFYVLAALLLMRLMWDVFQMANVRLIYLGDDIKLFEYMKTIDGFLILIPIFFGTLFPLSTLYFVKGTLDVKNTQSATGILYVILTSVLIADMSYKFFMIRSNIFL